MNINDHLFRLLLPVVVVLGVMLVTAAFRFLFPSHADDTARFQYTGETIERHFKRLVNFTLAYIILYLTLLLVNILYFREVGQWIQAWWLEGVSGFSFVFFHMGIYLVGFIIGLSVCGFLSSSLFRLILSRDNYMLYREFNARQWPFNIDKTARFLHLLAWCGAVVFCYFTANYSFEITSKDEIVIGEWVTFGKKKYEMRDVQQLSHDPHFVKGSKNTPKPFYEIRFKDGYRWDTDRELKGNHSYKATFEYLSKKTGVKVDTLRR